MTLIVEMTVQERRETLRRWLPEHVLQEWIDAGVIQLAAGSGHAITPDAEQEIRDRTPSCNEPEPDLVRYRCDKQKGHEGPHSWP